ncbi:hypothetical protein BKA62DRAFT_754812, partial [Auriculariales sp. MPI-PUGE-AT-0066]
MNPHRRGPPNARAFHAPFSAAQMYGEDEQPNESRRNVQRTFQSANNYRGRPIPRGYWPQRGGGRGHPANLIVKPNANSAPPAIPRALPAVPASLVHRSATHCPPPVPITPTLAPELSGGTSTIPAPLEISRSQLVDHPIKVEREQSPILDNLPHAGDLPSRSGTLFVRRPHGLSPGDSARSWKDQCVQMLRSAGVDILETKFRSDGLAIDWRSDIPVCIRLDPQSAAIYVDCSHYLQEGAAGATNLETSPAEASSSRDSLSSHAQPAPPVDAGSNGDIAEILLPIPTFLKGAAFNQQIFAMWVDIEKQELVEHGCQVLTTVIQQDEHMLELRVREPQPARSRRGRKIGGGVLESSTAEGDDHNVVISVPRFLHLDDDKRDLWIRVQIDRQTDVHNPQYRIQDGHLRIFSAPSMDSLLRMPDSPILKTGTVLPEAAVAKDETSRKRKRSTSLASEQNVVLTRRSESTVPISGVAERRPQPAQTGTGPSNTMHQLPSPPMDNQLEDTPRNYRVLADQFLMYYLTAFSSMNRSALAVAYDDSAVLTCDAGDILAEGSGYLSNNGMPAVGFDRIFARLGRMDNFVFPFGSEYELEILPIPDSRFMLIAQGDILYFPRNGQDRVQMQFRQTFHLRCCFEASIPFVITTH